LLELGADMWAAFTSEQPILRSVRNLWAPSRATGKQTGIQNLAYRIEFEDGVPLPGGVEAVLTAGPLAFAPALPGRNAVGVVAEARAEGGDEAVELGLYFRDISHTALEAALLPPGRASVAERLLALHAIFAGPDNILGFHAFQIKGVTCVSGMCARAVACPPNLAFCGRPPNLAFNAAAR
jgi:hypothetical protein